MAKKVTKEAVDAIDAILKGKRDVTKIKILLECASRIYKPEWEDEVKELMKKVDSFFKQKAQK